MASETVNTNNSVQEPDAGQTKASRIFYVDPNDVYGTSNGIPLTPDYTDLCISFDLTVETVPRTGYVTGKKSDTENLGKDVTQTYHFFWTSYQANSNPEDNYVSFTKGEEYLDRNYLTTYYTDINFNDFRNRDIVEGLGVESVSISFESYYMPTIKMRFIDVRGASLFGREEATHVDNKITNDSIWGCFFTFPYPKFRLQVKGFYGHAITYQLTCLDFRANFDSKTGNFVIDVTFLGYDYGIMSDIPTAYLLAAPYSPYLGADYWRTQCESERWRMSDGTPPSKLLEIRDEIKKRVRTAQKTEEGETVNDGSNGADDANTILELNELHGVKDSYKTIINYLTSKIVHAYAFVLYKFKVFDNEYYLFPTLTNEIWKKIVEHTSHFYDVLEKYKSNFPYRSIQLNNKATEQQLIFGRKIEKDEPVGGVGGKPKHFDCNNITSPFTPVTNLTNETNVGLIYTKNITNIQSYDFRNGVFVDVDSDFEHIPSLGFKEGFQIIPCGKTEEIFSNIERQLSSELEKRADIATQQQEETDSVYTRLNIRDIGILPTMENVFKTIMCHLETLMYMIYECKRRIDTQITSGDRTPEKLGITGYTFQDYKIPNNVDNGVISIPPWVAVCVDEKKDDTGIKENDYVTTMGWVGDFDGEVEWEEAKLIDGLSLGAIRIFEPSEAPNETYFGNASVFCLPTDVFSQLFPEGTDNNPTALGEYLAMRAAAMFGVVGYKQNAAEALGKADALNLLMKIGHGSIKSRFTKLPGNWKEQLKKSPTQNSIPDGGEKSYTESMYGKKPGCENPNARILTDDGNGKYRYTYSEYIHNRQPKKPMGDKRYGMVYIPVADERLTLGSTENNAPFLSSTTYYGDVAYRDVKANLTKKTTDGKFDTTRIYHKCSSQAFLDINQGDKDTYDNEAMFNVFGGSSLNETFEKIAEEYTKLDSDAFTVDNYEDLDTTWRKTLKEYWNLDDNNYLTDNVIEENRYTVVDNTKDCDNFIFYNKFFYNQNTPPTSDRNEFVIEASKCLLFLSSAGYDIVKVTNLFNNTDKKHVFQQVPYGAMLLLGGLLWRSDQENDCILWLNKQHGTPDTHKTESTLTFSQLEKELNADEKTYINIKTYDNYAYILDTKWDGKRFPLDSTNFDANIKNKLVKEFKTFVTSNDGWVNLQKYEITFDGNQLYDAANFVSYYKEEQKSEEGKKSIETWKTRFYGDEYVKALDNPVILSYGSLMTPDDVNTEITFDKSCWNSYADAFCAKLDEIAAYEPTFQSDVPSEEKNKEKDLKKAMYMYIKRLWDRWFMMASPEQFKVENYMKNFIFMDSFYRNIGTMLHVNCEKLCEALENVNGESMFYQLISKLTTDHHCMFFALPDYFGFGDDNVEQENSKVNSLDPMKKIQDMFKPIPYSKKDVMQTSNKYIVMLVYDHNENLAHINDYTDDGFDIYSHDGAHVLPQTFNVPPYGDDLKGEDVPIEERRVKRYGYNIPSFGVTFGRQNNHLFKNVNIGMTNPIATEQSINALSLIAERGGGNDKKICFYGQDLFPVYNGYSYDCTVEMMGNVQIMPLMYFQLLNMPMFRGTYMIYSVIHTMRPGDMTTTFKGMKLSRYAAPFAQGWYVSARGSGRGFTYDGNGNLVSIDGGAWEDCDCSLNENDVTWDSKYFKLSQMVYSSTAKELGIDNCPPTNVKVNLKNLMTNCLDKLREKLGMPILVSSGYRSPKLNAIIQNRNNPNRKITEDSEAARKSQHVHGMAADISPIPYSVADLNRLFKIAVELWDFDQIIYEAPASRNPWIHISYKTSGNRHNMLYTNNLITYTTLTKDNWQNYIK